MDTSGESKPTWDIIVDLADDDKGRDVLRLICDDDDCLRGVTDCDTGTKSRSEVPLIILGVTVCLLGVEAGVSLGVLPPFDVLAAATNFSVWIYSSILPMDSFLWEF